MSATVNDILVDSELEHVEKESTKKELDLYCNTDQPSDIDLRDVDAGDLCKDSDLRILPNNQLMNTDDLVGSSSILINDPVVINSSSNNIANTLVLTSVFNTTPVKGGEPKHILFSKNNAGHDIDIKNDSSVLFTSPSQATFLIPSYYDSDHLVHVPTSNVPLYQSTVGSPLYENLPQCHFCEWQNCTEHFLTVDELVNHINVTHISGKDSIEYCCKWKDCVRRGKGFNARYKMLIHMRTHTGHKPHKCYYSSCNKRFSRLENLKIHIRTHTGEKPYACHYEGCDKRYSNSSDRFKHTRTHIESKPYHCKVEGCFKQYTDPSSLRKHLKAHKLGGTVIVNTPI